MPSIDDLHLAVPGKRDPETLLGPVLWLMTRLARERGEGTEAKSLRCALVAHCTALAAHPGVPLALRMAAGGLAIEHRASAASDVRSPLRCG